MKISDNEYFVTLTAERQCHLIAAILESKGNGERKNRNRIHPNDVAKVIRTWLKLKKKEAY
jgi:hypothetical protein